jgi:hypothetical protein
MLVVERFAPLGQKGSEKKENEMRLLYIVTKGMGDPTLASVPLHIAANGSVDLGQEVWVVLAGDATDLVIEDNMQRLEGVGVPPARELSLAPLNGRWAAPTDVARLAAQADRVLTF